MERGRTLQLREIGRGQSTTEASLRAFRISGFSTPPIQEVRQISRAAKHLDVDSLSLLDWLDLASGPSPLATL
jgi:hypothetical protein